MAPPDHRADVAEQAEWILRYCDLAALRHAVGSAQGGDRATLLRRLTSELELGGAHLLRIPPRARRLDAPAVQNLSDLFDPVGPGGEEPAHDWVAWVCVGLAGESFAGARFRLRVPGGNTQYGTLDGRSSFRVDRLAESGTCHLELSTDSAAAQGAPPPLGGLPATGDPRVALGRSIGLRSGRDHVVVITPVEPVTDGPVPLFPNSVDIVPERELVFEVVSAQGLQLSTRWSVGDTAAEHGGDAEQAQEVRQKVHAKIVRVDLRSIELAEPSPEAAP